MKIRANYCYLIVVLTLLKAGCLYAQTETPAVRNSAASAAVDRDLMEVTVPQLQQF